MSEPMRIGLDNPAFHGRLRVPGLVRPRHPDGDSLTPARPTARFDQQVRRPTQNDGASVTRPIWMRPLSRPARPHFQVPATSAQPLADTVSTEASPDLDLSSVHSRAFNRPKGRRYTKLQLALVGLAIIVFGFGLAVSIQAFLTNHQATAQVAALSKKSHNGNNVLPNTTKPSTNALSQYVVAPDLPRYIKIPKLGVDARVLQVGVTSSGALGTPSNVYDTAWYTGSAKPGQPGATLIDGHVSSWTTHGVFYGLKLLHPGDTIQIQRGDGQLLNYRVVKSQTYPDNKVDMHAAMTPVVAGKSGLNLITCAGQVKKGTSEFNQRIIVFAEQI